MKQLSTCRRNGMEIGVTPAVAALVTALLGMTLWIGCSRERPEERAEVKPPENQTYATPLSKARGTPVEETAPEGGIPRMIDLGRGWCIPCKKMEPILRELRQKYEGKAVIEIIDLDEDEQAAQRYGIRVMPTQIFFDAEGGEVWRHEGFLSREAIIARFLEMGVEPPDD